MDFTKFVKSLFLNPVIKLRFRQPFCNYFENNPPHKNLLKEYYLYVQYFIRITCKHK